MNKDIKYEDERVFWNPSLKMERLQPIDFNQETLSKRLAAFSIFAETENREKLDRLPSPQIFPPGGYKKDEVPVISSELFTYTPLKYYPYFNLFNRKILYKLFVKYNPELHFGSFNILLSTKENTNSDLDFVSVKYLYTQKTIISFIEHTSLIIQNTLPKDLILGLDNIKLISE